MATIMFYELSNYHHIYLASIRDRVACQLKDGLDDGSSSTNNFSGKRRKRSTESNTKVVVQTKSIYGCPPDFEKVSEYLCLHLSRNTAGHARKQTFPQSKLYCDTKGNGANVAFIANKRYVCTISFGIAVKLGL